MARIVGLLLAAGQGRRFGADKLLQALADDPRHASELVNFSVTPAEEGASGFVTAVAAR